MKFIKLTSHDKVQTQCGKFLGKHEIVIFAQEGSETYLSITWFLNVQIMLCPQIANLHLTLSHSTNPPPNVLAQYHSIVHDSKAKNQITEILMKFIKCNLKFGVLDIMRSFLRSHMMVTKTPPNVHKIFLSNFDNQYTYAKDLM